MKLPMIRGVMDRRLLVNYRVEFGVAEGFLPPPFRPQRVRGWAIAGLCLLRLRKMRTRFWPAALGLDSENAAHRIAVEWTEHGALRTGVYVMRRDTASRVNAWVGGRFFPGVHHRARFDVREERDEFHVAMTSDDGRTRLALDASVAPRIPTTSVFRSLAEASEFFRAGSLGYSPTSHPSVFDGLELRTSGWAMAPLDVRRVRSSFYDDRGRFPRGTIELDSAFVMRGLPLEWRGRETLWASNDQDARDAAAARDVHDGLCG